MTHEEASYFAKRAASESPCRSKRGVVIWDAHGVVSIGNNHQPAPFPCDGSAGCKANCGKTAIHAEQKAILLADRARLVGAQMLHVKIANGLLEVSGGPSCIECSKLILESGIAYMWLFRDSGWEWYTAAEFHRESVEAHSIVLLPPAVSEASKCL